MKTSLIQQAYAFIMTNPGVSTSEVADHIGRSAAMTSGWLLRAERKGRLQVVTRGQPGRSQSTWAITNRPVKFNTGDSVRRRANKIVMQKKQVGKLLRQIDALRKVLETLA